MAVTREEVLHIAALARIRLEESRVDTLASELNSILKHIEVLSSAETGTVKGIAESKAGTPLRDDVSAPAAMSTGLESFAPEMKDGFIIVPRLATHEDSAESGA